MATKITTPNINIDAKYMEVLGKRAIDMVEKDAWKGISQAPDGRKFGSYRSKSYIKQKSRYMKRLTNRRGAKGSNLKAVASGQSVISNQTSFVNEILTGRMLRDMSLRNARNNYVEVHFMPKDTGKILGAQRLGREVVGLNNKNVELLQKDIVKYLDGNIQRWAKEDIVINIGK